MTTPEDPSPREVITTHLVKGEDLNHHHTLYAGRCVEWCVHAAYLTAQGLFEESRRLVFMSIRSLSMRSPAFLGEMVQFCGCVDYIGESTLGVRIDGRKLQNGPEGKPVVTGTFLFCTTDEEGRALAHGLTAPAKQSGAQRWKAIEERALSEKM